MHVYALSRYCATTFEICTIMSHVSSSIYGKAISNWLRKTTVYPKKYAHGFVVLCFVVVMQSFIMNSHEVFIHIHQGCFAGTGAIVRLPQCQWSKPDGYGKISQCIRTTKHSIAKTVCIFLGIYCTCITTFLIGSRLAQRQRRNGPNWPWSDWFGRSIQGAFWLIFCINRKVP